jgi:hypothetical protein
MQFHAAPMRCGATGLNKNATGGNDDNDNDHDSASAGIGRYL